MNAEVEKFANAVAAVALGEQDSRATEFAHERRELEPDAETTFGTKKFFDKTFDVDEQFALTDDIAQALGLSWLPGRIRNGCRVTASITKTHDRVSFTIEIEELPR